MLKKCLKLFLFLTYQAAEMQRDNSKTNRCISELFFMTNLSVQRYSSQSNPNNEKVFIKSAIFKNEVKHFCLIK